MKWNIYTVIVGIACMIVSCGSRKDAAQEAHNRGRELVMTDKEWNEGGEQLLRSLGLQDENNPTEMLASTYYHLSYVYWQQDYADKALEYALKAMKVAEVLKNDSISLKVLNRVASAYYLAQKHDSAHHYYNRLLEESLQAKDSAYVLNAYNNIGAVMISNSKPEEAMGYFKMGQAYSQHRKKDEFTYHYNLSRCYQNMGQWEECAHEIHQCIQYTDSTDIEGLTKLYRRLHKTEKNLGNFQQACAAADSSFRLSDSLFHLKQREELKNITEKYQQEKYETELRLQRAHYIMIIIGFVCLFALIIGSIIYRDKRHMENLQKRMEALNLQMVRKEQEKNRAQEAGNDESITETDANNELEQLFLEQFRVSLDILKTRPTYNKVRQLKYHTDKNYLSDEVRIPIIDGVLEVFIEQLQRLRTLFPELTEDECLYAVLIFIGCNNATASILTKTSEPTLRKRRSRFKQKTNEQVFNMLFKNE